MKKVFITILIIVELSLTFFAVGCSREKKIDKYLELLKEESFSLSININIPVLGDKNYTYKKEDNKILYNDNGTFTYEERVENGYHIYTYKNEKWNKALSKTPFLEYDINYIDEKISETDFTREGNIYKLLPTKYYDVFENYDFKDLTVRLDSNKECVITVDYQLQKDIYWKITARIYNIGISSVVIPLAF